MSRVVNIYKLWIYGKIDKAIVMYPRRMVCKPTFIDDKHLTYRKAAHFLKDKEVKGKIYWRCEDKDYAARLQSLQNAILSHFGKPNIEYLLSGMKARVTSTAELIVTSYISFTGLLRCRRWISWRGFFHWRDSMQVSGSWHRFWRRTLASEIVITAHRDLRFQARSAHAVISPGKS